MFYHFLINVLQTVLSNDKLLSAVKYNVTQFNLPKKKTEQILQGQHINYVDDIIFIIFGAFKDDVHSLKARNFLAKAE